MMRASTRRFSLALSSRNICTERAEHKTLAALLEAQSKATIKDDCAIYLRKPFIYEHSSQSFLAACHPYCQWLGLRP
ncbi:hypothetical protein PLUA15_220125 [Pseudomonas lundensis]|uniref:Uncharacterized protein n=1 Tax=Pseudomonas lundensis TaxID=86185 RepID=A0AAX2H6V0_9PSED|nr:hypothetical protein PLUA15_220125 [Pseudomonas lundensis]